jgi:hypothetical protein
MRRWLRSKTASRSQGQVIVLFALFSTVLVGGLALAVDVGYLLSERRHVQGAADAAAMAGGVALLYGESDGGITSAAETYAETNGIGGDATIDVDIDGDQWDGRVEVEIETPVQRFFLGVIYQGDWSVSARAVAEVNDERDGEYALLALDPAGMYFNGAMTVTVNDGSAMSNGNISSSGGANVFTSDGTIDAAGTISGNDNWSAGDGMFENRPESPDPLVDMQPPPPSFYSSPMPNGTGNACRTGNCTLAPGYYKNLGRLRIRDTATLQPGVYIFEGTYIELLNSNSRIQGNGVMLYFDGPAGSTYFDPKTGAVDITAPATVPYADAVLGIAVWIANCSTFDSQGNQEFYIGGVFYAPCSTVYMHGNPYGVSVEGQVIVGDLDIRGTSDFEISYVSYVATPRHELYLVE